MYRRLHLPQVIHIAVAAAMATHAATLYDAPQDWSLGSAAGANYRPLNADLLAAALHVQPLAFLMTAVIFCQEPRFPVAAVHHTACLVTERS